jgi:hypothetical protein
MKNRFKISSLFVVALILCALCFGVLTRHTNNLLQSHAKEFLVRPTPSMFQTNQIGGFNAGNQGIVLDGARSLIEQYATDGRLPDSSAIACRMNLAQIDVGVCEYAAQTNDSAKIYVKDCKSILNEICQELRK